MEQIVCPTETWLSSYGDFQLASQIHLGTLNEIHIGNKNKIQQWNECRNLLQVCLGNSNMMKIPTLLFGKRFQKFTL